MDSVAFAEFKVCDASNGYDSATSSISGNLSGHQHRATPTYQIGLHISVRQDQLYQTMIDPPGQSAK
jgi:hypothetical protein